MEGVWSLEYDVIFEVYDGFFVIFFLIFICIRWLSSIDVGIECGFIEVVDVCL